VAADCDPPRTNEVKPGTVMIVRCVERSLVIIAAISLAFLGVWLYARGIETGEVTISFLGFVSKGQGPGLAMVAIGAFLLYHSLKTPFVVIVRHEPSGTPGTPTSSRIEILGRPAEGTTKIP
jgi:hypothetical protein